VTTENEVKIDITANDQASAVIVKAAENAEAAMKRVEQEQKKVDASRKESFRNTKASTEFFGQIANIAGGGQIAGIAGQLAGLTEKTAQFSEVAQQGGIAADAFKIGLMGAAGVIGMQIGKQIGSIVFEVERWNTELDKSIKLFEKLEGKRLTGISRDFSDFVSGLDIAGDKDLAVQEKIERLGNELRGMETSTQHARNELMKLQQQQVQGNIFGGPDELSGAEKLSAYLETFTGEFKATLAEKERILKADEQTMELYREQLRQLERMQGIEKERQKLRDEQKETEQSGDFITRLEEQLSGLQSELSGTTNITDAIKSTIAADRDSAIALLDEIDKTKQQIKDKQ